MVITWGEGWTGISLRLSSANQKAHQKHTIVKEYHILFGIVFSAYTVSIAMHHAVSSDDLYIVCNAL